jgi:uncharacterized RDD family membrane protein YckC
MQWYYERVGKSMGSVSDETLSQYLETGVIDGETLVWREGMSDWEPAYLRFPVASATATPQRSHERGIGDPRLLPRHQLAGFWIRFGAATLDVLAYLLVGIAVGLLLTVLGIGGVGDAKALDALSVPIGIVINAAFDSSAWQGRPGKRMLNLAIVDSDGRRISFGRALRRCIARLISAVTLGIGFAMIGWTRLRQGLHDVLAETFVVRRT